MKIGPHIEVTKEMIEAAHVFAGHELFGIPDEGLAQIYRAMRALEPGPHQDGPARDFVPATMGVRRV